MSKCVLCGRSMGKTIEKRYAHFASKHPDVILGYGLRIARDPRAFGAALGNWIKNNINNGRVTKILQREGII